MKKLRGMRDLSGSELALHNYIIAISEKFAFCNNFNSVQLPILESTTLFNRLGDDSDIVAKELYQFEDKKNRSICLRPEFTSSVVRNFIAMGPNQQKYPYKMFASGSLFRYDRPQQGRYREFTQVNFEVFDKNSQHSDQDIIDLVKQLLDALKIEESKYTIEVNKLPEGEQMEQWKQRISTIFTNNKSLLSEKSQQSINTNPLRILDSKSPQDKDFVTQNIDTLICPIDIKE